jgi:hypothetical protein
MNRALRRVGLAVLVTVMPLAVAVPAHAQTVPTGACSSLPYDLAWSNSPSPDRSVSFTVTLASTLVSICEAPPGVPTVGVTTSWGVGLIGNCALAQGGNASTGYYDLWVGNVLVFANEPAKALGVWVGYPVPGSGEPCSNGPVTFQGVGAGD